jgi:phage shock protein C
MSYGGYSDHAIFYGKDRNLFGYPAYNKMKEFEMENRRLTRCESDRMVAGVCSGLGRYLNIDTTIVRLIFALMFLLGGHGLLVYIILWIVMPSDSKPQAVVEVNTQDRT